MVYAEQPRGSWRGTPERHSTSGTKTTPRMRIPWADTCVPTAGAPKLGTPQSSPVHRLQFRWQLTCRIPVAQARQPSQAWPDRAIRHVNAWPDGLRAQIIPPQDTDLRSMDSLV